MREELEMTAEEEGEVRRKKGGERMLGRKHISRMRSEKYVEDVR